MSLHKPKKLPSLPIEPYARGPQASWAEENAVMVLFLAFFSAIVGGAWAGATLVKWMARP